MLGSLLAQLDDLPFSPGGPLWYRGTSLENERILRVPVDTVLRFIASTAHVGPPVIETRRWRRRTS